MAALRVNSYSSLGNKKGLEGLMSGLETSEIVKAYTSNTRNRIQTQMQKRQQEQWKQQQIQEITKKIQNYYNKYFSYSSSNNIFSSKFFDTSKIESSNSKVSATGDSDAVKNLQIKNVTSLASAATLTSTHKISTQSMQTGEIKTDWQTNSFAGSSFTFDIDGVDTTVEIASDFQFSDAALAVDADGNLTDDAKALQISEVKQALTDSISAAGIAGKIEVTETDGVIGFKSTDGSDFSIKSTTGKAASLLKLETGKTGAEVVGTEAFAGDTAAKKQTLAEALAGTSLTVTYNGISKQITFNETDKDKYATVDDLAAYMQSSLDKSYGVGKVNLTSSDGKISFASSDSSSIFAVNNSTGQNIIGDGDTLFGMKAGESNRTELLKTLDEIADSLATPLQKDANGKYSMSINGVDFSFDGDTLFGDMIGQINRSDANVNISYSSVTDTLSVSSTLKGSGNTIDIQDSGASNLATALFGTQGVDYTVKDGTDFVAEMSFDGGVSFTTVNRTDNSFEIDGVTMSFNSTIADGETVTFNADANVDAMVDKVKEFVDGYNDIIDTLYTKVKEKKYGRESYADTDEYLPLTDEQKEEMSEDEIEKWEKKAQTGLLSNDSTLYRIMNNMRSAMNQIVGEDGLGLYQFGIQTSSDYTQGGKLVIDEEKLKAKLSTNADDFEELMTNTENGLAYNLQNVFKDAAIGNEYGDGVLVQLAGKPGNDSYQSIMSTKISNYTSQLSLLKTRLQKEETRWWNKFSSLESYINTMNSQFSVFSGYFE